MSPQRADSDKVAVEINGNMIYVPKNIANVYLIEVHTDDQAPKAVTGAILTTDLMFAWTWLIEGLADGGWGKVVAFDVLIKSNPRWSHDLGRIDGPTKHPNQLKFTSAEP